MDYIKTNKINLPELVRKYRIVGFGEYHHGQHDSAIKIIANNFYLFTGLFLQLPINFQLSVDHYIEFGEYDDRLKRYFLGAQKEGKDIETDITAILTSAKNKNVKVWCIDSSKIKTEIYDKQSLHGHYFLNGESRNEDMFNNICQKINTNEKWCILCGYQHLKYCNHFRSGDKTLGSRLKEKYGDFFVNIALVNQDPIDLKIQTNEFDKCLINQ